MITMNRRTSLACLASIFASVTLPACAAAGPLDDFYTAIIRDDAGRIRSMLQRGQNPNVTNAEGIPPLVFALQKESLKAFAALMESKTINVEQRNKKDESALMIAAIQGRLDIARQLITRGGDVNKTGWTPLHYAASSEKPESVPMIQLLLENYAYIDAASPNGTTPLMMAVRYGTAESARLLIEEGADPSLRNEKGLTAVDFATQADRGDMARVVMDAITKRRPSSQPQPKATW